MANKIDLVCPECGVSMEGLDPYAHSLVHYPDYLPVANSSKLARARQDQIRKGGVTASQYDKEHTTEVN